MAKKDKILGKLCLKISGHKSLISIITGTDYASVSKTSTTSEKDIKITGKDEGEVIIQITYSTGDIEYYYAEILD